MSDSRVRSTHEMEEFDPPRHLRQIVHALESLQRGGMLAIPRPRRRYDPPHVPVPISHIPPNTRPVMAGIETPEGADLMGGAAAVVAPAEPVPMTNILGLDRRQGLEVMAQEVAQCTRCTELACSRQQTVFGVGNIEPRLVFLGEAPGADEDRQGTPFVGAAGQLLTKIIDACTLQRKDVYIMNVLKCRPPNNRNPLPAEVEHCRPFFERQLEILKPEFICCLGLVAATALLQATSTVGQLRGRFHSWRGIQVIVTYHPSYLLRTPTAKRYVWDDMKYLMRAMGIPLQ